MRIVMSWESFGGLFEVLFDFLLYAK
ncbi:Protein of unknown function [Bacillus mobilis]|nr:Protein of unknown function [Bacillus mobilis]